MTVIEHKTSGSNEEEPADTSRCCRLLHCKPNMWITCHWWLNWFGLAIYVVIYSVAVV